MGWNARGKIGKLHDLGVSQPIFVDRSLSEKIRWIPIRGSNPKDSKNHFFAAKALRQGVTGILFLDGDDRGLAERETTNQGLEILRWQRYKIENDLLILNALKRFVTNKGGALFGHCDAKDIEKYFKYVLAPDALEHPFGDNPSLTRDAASKSFLKNLFAEVKLDIFKNDDYLIAEAMLPDEIHPEVKKNIEIICKS